MAKKAATAAAAAVSVEALEAQILGFEKNYAILLKVLIQQVAYTIANHEEIKSLKSEDAKQLQELMPALTMISMNHKALVTTLQSSPCFAQAIISSTFSQSYSHYYNFQLRCVKIIDKIIAKKKKENKGLVDILSGSQTVPNFCMYGKEFHAQGADPFVLCSTKQTLTVGVRELLEIPAHRMWLYDAYLKALTTAFVNNMKAKQQEKSKEKSSATTSTGAGQDEEALVVLAEASKKIERMLLAFEGKSCSAVLSIMDKSTEGKSGIPELLNKLVLYEESFITLLTNTWTVARPLLSSFKVEVQDTLSHLQSLAQLHERILGHIKKEQAKKEGQRNVALAAALIREHAEIKKVYVRYNRSYLWYNNKYATTKNKKLLSFVAREISLPQAAMTDRNLGRLNALFKHSNAHMISIHEVLLMANHHLHGLAFFLQEFQAFNTDPSSHDFWETYIAIQYQIQLQGTLGLMEKGIDLADIITIHEACTRISNWPPLPFPELLAPNRILIDVGLFRVAQNKFAQGVLEVQWVERVLFLFNDIVVLTNQSYEYISHIMTKNCQVSMEVSPRNMWNGLSCSFNLFDVHYRTNSTELHGRNTDHTLFWLYEIGLLSQIANDSPRTSVASLLYPHSLGSLSFNDKAALPLSVSSSLHSLVGTTQSDTNLPEVESLRNINAILFSYVPRVLLDKLVRNFDNTQIIDASGPSIDLLHEQANLESFPHAAVLFADISGFTKLNETFAKYGPSGVEQVTLHLNRYFSSLLDLIESHGGDCIKFAGDALIVLFSAVHHTQSHICDKSMSLEAQTSLRAVQCAMDMQKSVGYYKDQSSGVELSLHIAVSAGPITNMHVGSYQDEWEFLIAGHPFKQLYTGVSFAKSGQVVVSKEVWALVSKRCIATSLRVWTGEMLVEEVTLPVKLAPLPPLHPKLADSYDLADAVRAYLSDCIIQSVDAGISVMGELRRASMIFVNMQGIVLQKHVKSVLHTQEAFVACQKVIHDNAGYRRQFLVDDKGTTLIVVFGVPPFAHEDDPFRAVRTALELRSVLLKLKVDHSIGIATGNVYAGAVGSLKRREYAVVGDTVNLSARLSGQSRSGGILCDKTTYDLVKSKITMQCEGTIKVKGKDEQINIYTPLEVSKNLTMMLTDGASNLTSDMFNRQEELDLFAEALRDLSCIQEGSTFFIEAEAGMGKTFLSRSFYKRALEMDVKYKGEDEATVEDLVFTGNKNGQRKTVASLLESVRGGKKDLSKFSRALSLIPMSQLSCAPPPSKQRIVTYFSASDSTSQTVPFHLWSTLLEQMISLDEEDSGNWNLRKKMALVMNKRQETNAIKSKRRSQKIFDFLSILHPQNDWPTRDWRIPLLNPILGLDVNENEYTQKLSPQRRIDVTKELVMDILELSLTTTREPVPEGHVKSASLSISGTSDGDVWEMMLNEDFKQKITITEKEGKNSAGTTPSSSSSSPDKDFSPLHRNTPSSGNGSNSSLKNNSRGKSSQFDEDDFDAPETTKLGRFKDFIKAKTKTFTGADRAVREVPKDAKDKKKHSMIPENAVDLNDSDSDEFPGLATGGEDEESGQFWSGFQLGSRLMNPEVRSTMTRKRKVINERDLTVWVVEDVHLLDKPSLDLLVLMCSQKWPLIVVMTARVPVGQRKTTNENRVRSANALSTDRAPDSARGDGGGGTDGGVDVTATGGVVVGDLYARTPCYSTSRDGKNKLSVHVQNPVSPSGSRGGNNRLGNFYSSTPGSATTLRRPPPRSNSVLHQRGAEGALRPLCFSQPQATSPVSLRESTTMPNLSLNELAEDQPPPCEPDQPELSFASPEASLSLQSEASLPMRESSLPVPLNWDKIPPRPPPRANSTFMTKPPTLIHGPSSPRTAGTKPSSSSKPLLLSTSTKPQLLSCIDSDNEAEEEEEDPELSSHTLVNPLQRSRPSSPPPANVGLTVVTSPASPIVHSFTQRDSRPPGPFTLDHQKEGSGGPRNNNVSPAATTRGMRVDSVPLNFKPSGLFVDTGGQSGHKLRGSTVGDRSGRGERAASDRRYSTRTAIRQTRTTAASDMADDGEFGTKWVHNYHLVKEIPRLKTIQLSGLTYDMCGRVLCHRLKAKSISVDLLQQLMEKTKGNPMYTIELALCLLDMNIIQIEAGGHCSISPKHNSSANISGSIDIVNLPAHLSGVITQRVASLNVTDLLVCKMASLFGQSFDEEMLSILYIREGGNGEHFAQAMESLILRNIICEIDEKEEDMEDAVERSTTFVKPSFGTKGRTDIGVMFSDSTHRFEHELVHRAAYSLFLVQQKVLLHGHIAEIYCERFTRLQDGKPLIPAQEHVLSYHYALCLQNHQAQPAGGEGAIDDSYKNLIKAAERHFKMNTFL